MNKGRYGKLLVPALCFIVGFAAAFPVAWMIHAPSAPRVSAPTERAGMIARGEVEMFLQAVDVGDFAAMRDRGGEIFREGRKMADAKSIFSRFEANSIPPYAVYAFFTRSDPDMTRRIMLTLDGDDAVVSFMAEEMAVNAF